MRWAQRLKRVFGIDVRTMVRSSDGFEIAEADLRLRGPGDFFGTRQSGMPTLRMARLDDREILVSAREEARALVAKDPALKRHPALSEAVRARRRSPARW